MNECGLDARYYDLQGLNFNYSVLRSSWIWGRFNSALFFFPICDNEIEEENERQKENLSTLQDAILIYPFSTPNIFSGAVDNAERKEVWGAIPYSPTFQG